MFVDFENTNIHVQKLQAIIGEMETNAANISKLPAEIAPAFGGATAEAHVEITRMLNSKLGVYTAKLAALKSATGTVAGSGGDFQTSDQVSAKGFDAGSIFA
ncbi:hypothetical protein AB0L57_30025 [Nocardia sp. NPDC052254]|uniref:hypothetical protein n=1 Tax=Nocardia sp. NPDC052254 TaxID=3155681 RepID=UPI003419335F